MTDMDLSPRNPVDPAGPVRRRKRKWMPVMVLGLVVVAGGFVVTKLLNDAVDYYCNVDEVGVRDGCDAHGEWIRFVELYLGLYGLSPDDRILCCLQFFYNDPPWLFLTSLRAGAPLDVSERRGGSRSMERMAEAEHRGQS